MKKILTVVLATALVFAFTSTAFAGFSNIAQFSSGSFSNQFTTRESTPKPSGNWIRFHVKGLVDGYDKFGAQAIRISSGNKFAMSEKIIAEESQYTYRSMACHSYFSTSNVYMIIYNEASGSVGIDGAFRGETTN